jgi:hypothetical protein
MWCVDDWIIQTIFLIILVLLLIFALYWEWQDYSRLLSYPSLDEIPDDHKIAYLQELTCYSSYNNPIWREALFGTIIIGFILLFAFGCSVEFRVGILILFIIWVVFYGILSLNSYHIQRVICSKANPPYQFF